MRHGGKDREKYLDLYGKKCNPVEEASDVIIEIHDYITASICFQNMMTGVRKPRLHDVMRYDYRNIFCRIDTDRLDNTHTLNGYYAEYDKKHDALVYYMMKYDLTSPKEGEKRQWTEGIASYVFTRNKHCFYLDDNTKSFDGCRIDVCAECYPIFNAKDIKTDSDNTNVDHYYSCHTRAKDLIKDFYGGTIYGIGSKSYFRNNYDEMLVESMYCNPFAKLALATMPQRHNLKKKDKELLAIELPEVDKEQFVKYFTRGEKETPSDTVYSLFYMNQAIVEEETRVAIVQKVKENVSVIRVFGMCLKIREPLYEITANDIELCETNRIYLEGYKVSCFKVVMGEWQGTELQTVLYNKPYLSEWSKEDVEGTLLYNITPYIGNAFNDAWYEDTEGKTRSKNMGYRSLLDLSTHLLTVLQCQYAEKIYNSPYENIKQMFTTMLMECGECSALSNMFDEKLHIDIDGTKHRELEMPKKHMFQSLDKVYGLYYSEFLDWDVYKLNVDWRKNMTAHVYMQLKDLYDSSRQSDYFWSMNRDQFEKVLTAYYGYLVKNSGNKFIAFQGCISYLIELHGPKRILEYFEYVDKFLASKGSRFNNDYMDYLCMCLELMDYVHIKEWKFSSYEELEKAHDDVLVLYNANVLDKKYNRIDREKFEKRKEVWKDYLYDGETFSITAPDTIADIANEGYKLNHCVKSYINNVIGGKTNILFVRKTDDLEKPFYTLEIKDNAVRQCHGANNRNVDEVEGLKDFLEEYCKEKKIEFTSCDDILAAN